MTAFGAEAVSNQTVEAAVAGSPAERNQLLEQLSLQVRAMVMVRLAPAPHQFHAVEDLSQASLMAVAAGLETLRERTTSGLKSFVSAIVTHKVSEHLREAQRGGPRSPASLDSSIHDLSQASPLWAAIALSGSSPGSKAGRAEEVRQLLEALARLSESHRGVVALAFFDQLPISDIAERLEISRPAASMLLLRAVRALRREMTGLSKVQVGHVDKP